MFEPLLAALGTILDEINHAALNGLPLLVALLMSFFAGAFFALRRMRLDAALLWRHVLNPTSKRAIQTHGIPAQSSPWAIRALGLIAALYFSMAACMLYFSITIAGPGLGSIASASGFSAGTLLVGGGLALAFAIVEKRRNASDAAASDSRA